MISLILTLASIGVLLYWLNTKAPIDPDMKILIKVVVFIAVAIWLMRVFGVTDFPVPHFGPTR